MRAGRPVWTTAQKSPKICKLCFAKKLLKLGQICDILNRTVLPPPLWSSIIHLHHLQYHHHDTVEGGVISPQYPEDDESGIVMTSPQYHQHGIATPQYHHHSIATPKYHQQW